MNSPHRRLRLTGKRGLSLVELLMAMTIVSVAMLGIVGMFPVAHQHLRAGGDLTKATSLAQRMIELLRDEPLQAVPRYHNADTRTPSSFPADDPAASPPFRGGSLLIGWRDEIAAVRPTGGLYRGWGRIEVASLDRGLLSITVMVGWPATPTDRSVQLTTFLGQE
ncbi:MAG: type IV pilus modification PilV family protein [Candidatus Methylomirabilis sp.]